MDTTNFVDKAQVKMIAHRGVSALEKENTLPAFLLACERSYYGIETDVRATKDGQFVLFHDDDLQRCFGIDRRVDECDFAYLRSLRYEVEGLRREDLFIPTPKEYFDLCKQYDKHAIFELKPGLTVAQVEELRSLIEGWGWLQNTTFISFDFALLVELKKRYPTAQAYYLAGEIAKETEEQMVALGIHADVYHLTLSKERVKDYQAKGILLNCWTVDEVERAKTLKEWGVDFITSNRLE